MNKSLLFKVFMICLSYILLTLIYWAPPLNLIDEYKTFSKKPVINGEFKDRIERMLVEEHKKVTDEIFERNKQANQWFHWKFLIVGALIGGIFGYVGWKKEKFKNVLECFNSELFFIVVGISTILCLVIDIHIRNNITVVNQLGTWLTYYFEPAMTGLEFSANEKGVTEKLLGWEEFLRVESPPGSGYASRPSLWIVVLACSAYLNLDCVQLISGNLY